MRSRMFIVAIIAALAALIAVPAGGFAAAKHLITGKNVKNGSLSGADIKNGSVANKDIKKGSIKLDKLSKGTQALIRKSARTGVGGQTGGPPGPQGPGGAPGTNGANGTDASISSGNWGEISRNTVGSARSDLRSGPAGQPLGKGSLALDTADANSKVNYGNDTDFAGLKIADITALSYSVFTTDENRAKAVGNLPTLNMEVDPNVINGANPVNYSSLVYVPKPAAAGWSRADAADPSYGGFYFTNKATADATQCSQTNPNGYCTLAQLKAAAPDAVVTFSLGFNKGRDYEFHGAVDALKVNAKTYDFEESGVK